MNSPDPFPLDRFDAAVRRSYNVWIVLALAGIVALALGLRLYRIAEEGLSMDELWNLELTTGHGSTHAVVRTNELYTPPHPTALYDAGPWWRIPGSLRHVTHPPLYSIILRWWRALAGEGDGPSRALSAVMSALAVVPLFEAARLTVGRGAALLAALMMAVSGAQIFQGQEIRPYAQLLLTGMCLAAVAARIYRHGPSWPRVAMLGACMLGMMLTHYFAIGFVAGVALFLLLRTDVPTRRRCALAAGVAGAVFLLAWGPVVWEQRHEIARAGSVWMKDPSQTPRLSTLARAAEVPMRLLFEPRKETYPAPYLSIALLAICAVVVRWRYAALWVLIAAGTIGFVTVLDLVNATHQLDDIRYTLLGGPAVYALLAALGLAPLRGERPPRPGADLSRFRAALPVVAAAGCVLSLPGAYENQNADYRPLAAFFQQHAREGEVIVLVSEEGFEWYASFLYVPMAHYSTKFHPRPVALLRGEPEPALLVQLKSAPGVWAVASLGTSIERAIPGARVERLMEMPFAGKVARIEFIEPVRFDDDAAP